MNLAIFRTINPANLMLAMVFTLLALSSGGAFAQSAEDAYRLGSGDELKITVYNQPDLSGNFVVAGEGTISMPLIGDIAALDLTKIFPISS